MDEKFQNISDMTKTLDELKVFFDEFKEEYLVEEENVSK